GSIHEGGELGYSLVHAYGAVFDNPDLLVLCVVGDGEAETGPLAASWHSNKFLNPATDGAVLPVLHLNGYQPHFVVGDDPAAVHEQLAATLDEVVDRIAAIQHQARAGGARPAAGGDQSTGLGAAGADGGGADGGGADGAGRPVWPMIVLRTPKGWTGPKR